uniref:Uncharacterized protein n=1 Tax=Arundo donax TaxID=35708 RepID=A0A0A9GW74_ARUDO
MTYDHRIQLYVLLMFPSWITGGQQVVRFGVEVSC